jgi:putative SOS response-associated peptidase YedK
MCGRYVAPGEAEIEAFWHIGRHNWRSPYARVRETRFNVAPQQGNAQNHVPVIRADADGVLELTDMQWWLLPFWSKDARIKYATFNARVESVASSASFREPFRRRRCLIPARGWYEWQNLAGGKQAWYFHAPDNSLLAFAGLWDRWQGEAQVIESCTIIVGEAEAAVAEVHDRMPLLLPGDRHAAWLDPGRNDAASVRELLHSAAPAPIALHRVGKRVGNTANDGPELIEPCTTTP